MGLETPQNTLRLQGLWFRIAAIFLAQCDFCDCDTAILLRFLREKLATSKLWLPIASDLWLRLRGSLSLGPYAAMTCRWGWFDQSGWPVALACTRPPHEEACCVKDQGCRNGRFGKRSFCPLPKTGGFDENWRKCWYCILPTNPELPKIESDIKKCLIRHFLCLINMSYKQGVYQTKKGRIRHKICLVRRG